MLPYRPDGCILSMLSCLESSRTLMGIRTFNWAVRTVNWETDFYGVVNCAKSSWNYLLDACDTDNCHIKAISILEK